MDKILILLNLLNTLLEQGQAIHAQAKRISALIEKARGEGRDVSDEELAELVSDDDAARTALDEAIARAQAEGR